LNDKLAEKSVKPVALSHNHMSVEIITAFEFILNGVTLSIIQLRKAISKGTDFYNDILYIVYSIVV
jgi:hypothetical protein